jgi:hypothetical protein
MAIVEARRTVRTATAAAVSRENRGEEVEVWVRLLETPPSPGGSSQDPGGAGTLIAIFTAPRLGQDLADAFGDKCTIILR